MKDQDAMLNAVVFRGAIVIARTLRVDLFCSTQRLTRCSMGARTSGGQVSTRGPAVSPSLKAKTRRARN